MGFNLYQTGILDYIFFLYRKTPPFKMKTKAFLQWKWRAKSVSRLSRHLHF